MKATDPKETEATQAQSPAPAGEADRELYERLRAILAGAVDTLKLGGASIYLLNETRDVLSGHVSVDSHGQEVDIAGSSRQIEADSRLAGMMAGQVASLTGEQTGEGKGTAAVPLTVNDRIVGLLSARSQEGGSEAEENVDRLKLFASQAAFAMEAAAAASRWKQEAHHERTLFEVSRAISSALDPLQVQRLVAELMARGVRSDRSALYVIERDLEQLRRRASFGVEEDVSVRYATIPFDEKAPTVHTLESHRPAPVAPDSRERLNRELSESIGGRRGLAVPLLSKGYLTAIAVVACPEGAEDFRQDDVELLMAIAAQAAVSIENASLYDAQNRAVTEFAALYAVSQALAASPSLNDRLQVVAQSIMAVTGMSRCGVFLIEDGQARGYLLLGASPEEEEQFRRLRLDLSERETAMMQAIKTGKPTIIEQPAGRKDGYVAEKWRIQRMLAVPLIYEGRTVGLAAADEPGKKVVLGEKVIQVAAAIGEQAALAIQNARLFEQTRQHAEELGVLWEVAQVLGAEMEMEDLLDKLHEQIELLPFVVASSAIVRHWDGSLLVSRGAGRRSRLKSERGLTDPCDRISAQALNSETHVVEREVPLPPRSEFPRFREAGLDQAALLALPLRQRGETFGVLTLLAPGGHEFSTAELRLAGSIASVAAAALTRAQIFERERRIAETFQRTFLPQVPEQVGEFELAHQYAAALDEARVGGDFYDVFPTPDGRLALVTGDVSGKGLNAAVHTAMAKYLLRGFAHCAAEPGTVLRQVNDALCFYVPDNMFVTLFFGLLDTSSGLLYYANAGHEPPLLWSRKTGRVRSLASTGRALGFVPGGEFLCEEAAIERGDILVMYTDGVTEARNGGALFDVSGVRDAVRAAAGESAARVAELIETRAREHAGGRLTDDIALLVARRRG